MTAEEIIEALKLARRKVDTDANRERAAFVLLRTVNKLINDHENNKTPGPVTIKRPAPLLPHERSPVRVVH